jgi:hypothetical protein
MEARTLSSYGRYVNPRAAAGRLAGDSMQDFSDKRRIQITLPPCGGPPIPPRLDVDVQKSSGWQS